MSDDKISLCYYVLKDIEIPYYYDTKPVKVGTIYTYLLNIRTLRKSNDHIIDPFNDIDFILYYDSYACSYLYLRERSKLNFNNDKNYAILNEYMTNPQISKSSSQINSVNNYSFYSFYSDFTNVESTPTYIFKKFMIHALKNLIDIISSSQYNNFFKTKKTDDLFERDIDEFFYTSKDYPYFAVKNYFINVIQECISFTENEYYDTTLRYLKKLYFKYKTSLYNVNDLDYMNLEESIQLLFEIYCILHLYQSMHIEVSNYDDLFSDSSDFSFEKYENTITYKINVQDFNTTWFWNNNFKCLLDYFHDIFINENKAKPKSQGNIFNPIKKIHVAYNNFPLEYLFLLGFFSFFADQIKQKLLRTKNLDYIDLCEIETSRHIKSTIEHFNYLLLPYSFYFKYLSRTEDIDIFFHDILIDQIFKAPKNLYYYFNNSEYPIEDLFKPAIESYLLFSKHPIDQCSHCHMFFLKTSPNRKFCDSALTLKSGMTCKKEREAATDYKSKYQKTTNDFNQYLQKVTLKGDEPYTQRVYNILEKNKYFDSEKPKSFEKLSKSDSKDLLWMLNSFFNYSYAIMESMNFQKIVKDPTFKDIRYYNNNPNNFTSDAYTDLFEEYKKYTRTNKGNGVTEVFNIYDSLVEFSEDKDRVLNFKTIRSKSMQDLNDKDIEKLFEITEIVIHIFFLRLSNWYLEGIKDKPDFTYAFPEEFATSKLGNIQYMSQQYMSQDEIKNLEEKIEKKIKDPFIVKDIKNNIDINNDREDQVIKLIKKIDKNINKNHPVK